MNRKIVKRLSLIIGAVAEFVIVCFLLLLALLTMWTNTSKDRSLVQPKAQTIVMTSQSSAMKPSYGAEDVLFFKRYEPTAEGLPVGKIVCFYKYTNGRQRLATSRIKIVNSGENRTYRLQDDASSQLLGIFLNDADIIGVYTGFRLPGLGAPVESLAASSGLFFGTVIVPLAIILLADAVILVKFILDNRSDQEKNVPDKTSE